MARPYNPRSVLRHLPADLVRQFAASQRIPLAVEWATVAPGDADPIADAWLAMSPADRERFEGMLRAVHELASPYGIRTLVDEAAFQHIPLADQMDSVSGLPAKALWALLHAAPAFHTARRFVRSADLPPRYWRRRVGVPAADPDTSYGTRQRLAAALSDYFRRQQGRGHRVTVEHLPRAGRWHYLFCYPDDYAGTALGHDDRGRLSPFLHRPVFEVVYLYDPARGTLDLYAHGDKRVRSALEDAFFEYVLGCDPLAVAPARPAFELDLLLDRDLPLPTDPADRVSEVRVKRLKVALLDEGWRNEITANADRPADDIHDALDAILPPDRFPRSRLHVTQATLSLTYWSADAERDRRLTFDLSWPDSTTLKAREDDERALAEGLLRRWGVMPDELGPTARPGRVA